MDDGAPIASTSDLESPTFFADTVILTAFTVLIVAAIGFVIWVLINQLVSFISGIYGEVVYRFVRRT